MGRSTVTVVEGMYNVYVLLQYYNIVLLSAHNGGQWCFVKPLDGDGSTCEDLQTGMGPYPKNLWSYEACATPAPPKLSKSNIYT